MTFLCPVPQFKVDMCIQLIVLMKPFFFCVCFPALRGRVVRVRWMNRSGDYAAVQVEDMNVWLGSGGYQQFIDYIIEVPAAMKYFFISLWMR